MAQRFVTRLPKWTLGLLLATLTPALASAQDPLIPTGRIVAWGDDEDGQTDVPSTLVDPVQTVGGTFYTVARRSNGNVAAWGYNFHGETNVPAGLAGVTQISSGFYHLLALRSNGTMVAWGYNGQNQCNVPAGLTAVQAAAGGFHCLAVRSNGTVAAWGWNDYGQINVPAGLSGVVQVAGGYSHSLALKSDGTVAAWGDNQVGQINVPAGLSGVAQVATGYFHSLALKSDGTVVAWGRDDFGQSEVPAGLSDVVQVATGVFQSLALKSDGTVVAWGGGDYGEGIVPDGLTGVIQIGAGEYHSLAIVAAAHCVLDQSQIYAGGSATGTVKLAYPAGSGGTVVGLTCSDPSVVHVPDSVTVPEGATSATFPVTTDVDYSGREVTIQTSYHATPTVPAKLIVLGEGVSFTANHPVIYGGSTTKELMTLTLGYPVDTDQTFTIENFGPGDVSTPGSVTILAGQTTLKFYIVPAITTEQQDDQILVYHGGAGLANATITVKPIAGTLLLSPTDLYGGDPSQGTITLNAPVANALTIPLSVSRPVAGVPASVTVPAGSKTATFPISTSPVGKFTSVVVTATVNGKDVKGVLHLTPKSNLQSVTLATYLYGHQRINGIVRLATPAPAGGETVTLASSDPNLTVPGSILISAGATQANFTVDAEDVASSVDATVTAANAGVSAAAATQIRPLAISSLTLSSSSVSGGTAVTGTVNLNVVVSVDTVVYLTSDNPAVASAPDTVTIPAGSKTASFAISTFSPASAKNVKVTVSKNGTSAYRTLKVTP